MGGVEVSLGGNYRNAVLVGPDVAVPYIAPFGGYAVLSYAFADQKGLIQLTGRAAGARYIDTSETTEIDPYVDLDVSASFDLTPSLGLLVSIENMAGAAPERWAGYPQPPFVFTSGLRVQW
jgi:outer membrane cobalamin receptor